MNCQRANSISPFFLDAKETEKECYGVSLPRCNRKTVIRVKDRSEDDPRETPRNPFIEVSNNRVVNPRVSKDELLTE